ncbi:MAG: sigma-70 family RNA polymerase sigma factor [Nocardioides sp.]|uniref:RNA polymerase sigma factor n=1 Tax=Nocardioides sp. TaxID=35761 RepID=UPI0039E5FF39
MTTTATSGSTTPEEDPEAPGALWAQATAAFDRWMDADPEALNDLVAVMTPVLWHVVRAYGLSRERTEDVIQQTWLALVRSSTSILDSTAVGGWLTVTARREAWRTAKRGQRDEPVEEIDLDLHVPSQRSAESEALEHDRDERLWRAVSTLPERCQRLLRVVAFENRPDYAALAADLQMPVGSIGPTRGRCLAKLRVALIEAGEA